MGKFIAEQTIKHMIQGGSPVKDAKVIVLGLTFKENCGDLRNSRVIDIIEELKTYGVDVLVHEPIGDAEEALREYGVGLTPWDKLPQADAIVAAVAHREFLERPLATILSKLKPGGAFIDVKSAFDMKTMRDAGITVWRL
jgi:UDP-N-acetyl-D-galactosamine dehydrogenase